MYISPCEILAEERRGGFSLLHFTTDRKYNVLTLVNKFDDRKMIVITKDNKIVHAKLRYKKCLVHA